jgi:CubicO group peptidase (beta-lactamase class C family)
MRSFSSTFTFIVLSICVWFASAPVARGQSSPLLPTRLPSAALDAYIAKGLTDWQIPGLAIVVVKDGKIAYMKGFGFRTLNGKDPVTPQTQFLIASNTKLFTGTALGWLAAKKRLRLDAPVASFLPGFRIYDSLNSAQTSVRDLLLHRIGTKTFQGDFTYLNSTLTRDQIISRIALMKPSGVFRQSYGYCNSCYLAAGQVLNAVTGTSWEGFITDSLLTPLEMRNTTALGNATPTRSTNMASSYTTAYTGSPVLVPFDRWDNLAPAASMISTVEDLSHWLMAQLDSGRYNGKQIIPFAALDQTRNLGIVTNSRTSPRFPTHFRGYGLGISGFDYAGRMVYHHTGGAIGQVSSFCFVPEEKLGIAILTNQDEQGFFEALRAYLLDAYLNVPEVDRSAQALTQARKDEKTQLDSIAYYQRLTAIPFKSPPLAQYTGIYTNSFYGNITLKSDRKALLASFQHHPDLTATFTPMADGRWLCRFSNISYGIHATRLTPTQLTLKVNEYLEIDPYIFTRTAPR